MSSLWVVIALSLASALAFAASSSLKHISAAAVPDAQSLQPGKLKAFVRATVRHRLWISGIGCDVIAVSLQIVALHFGGLAIVQPLLITGLLFALLFRRWHDPRQVTRDQLWWAVLVCVGLASFMVLAAGTATNAHVDRLPAAIAGATGAVVAVACVVQGRRMSAGGGAAALLGVAVGLIYAATAALLKAVTTIATTDLDALPASWQLYLTIVLGAAGLLLNQLAFQAGPMAASLPATASVDPLASIAVGVIVFDEHVRQIGWGIPLVVSLVVLAVGVVQLSRSAPIADDRDEKPESDERAHTGAPAD